jgi:D-sedoheptulose 7-phosphate isomerase
MALTTDTSALTCISNDYSFEHVFSRQVEALGKKDDVIIGISTSGNSGNVIKAFDAAKKIGIKTIGLLGNDGGKIKSLSDISIIIPNHITARIQEAHIFIGHIICQNVEYFLLKNN